MLICCYLIYLYQVFNSLNQTFQKILMYQCLLHFLNLLLLHSIFTLPPKDIVSGKYSLIYAVFFINPTVKRTALSFSLNINFITFSLYYFFNSKHFLICFLHFFCVKHFNNFFDFKITNNTVLLTFCQSQKLLQTNLEHSLFQKCFYILIF